jgi:hypothetical protein
MTIRLEYLITKILGAIVVLAVAFGLWELLKG